MRRSGDGFGIFLVLALVDALLWVLYDFGVFSLDNTGLNVWLSFLALSLVFKGGLNSSQVPAPFLLRPISMMSKARGVIPVKPVHRGA